MVSDNETSKQVNVTITAGELCVPSGLDTTCFIASISPMFGGSLFPFHDRSPAGTVWSAAVVAAFHSERSDTGEPGRLPACEKAAKTAALQTEPAAISCHHRYPAAHPPTHARDNSYVGGGARHG
jgi:hypothetical protein